MREDLPTMILLNMGLDIAHLENMEDELLSQVILHPEHSISLLQEALMVTTLSTKIRKYQKT